VLTPRGTRRPALADGLRGRRRVRPPIQVLDELAEGPLGPALHPRPLGFVDLIKGGVPCLDVTLGERCRHRGCPPVVGDAEDVLRAVARGRSRPADACRT